MVIEKRSVLVMIWTGLSIAVFVLLALLFRIAVPGAAYQFAAGATALIIGGMLAGWYTSRAWFGMNQLPPPAWPGALIVFIIVGLVVIAFLMNKMVDNTRLFDFAMTMLMLFLVTAAFGATVSLFRIRSKYRLQAAQAAAAHSKSELQLLQSQLSPHFLFNTLNNIYGLSLSDHTKVPQLLLRLSDLLRYSVYEAKELFVPVGEELDYLSNYIEFEKIRLGETCDLVADFNEIRSKDFRIAPMLLVVFVENAFKHGRSIDGSKMHIHIDMHCAGDWYNFSVVNSKTGLRPRSSLEQRHSGFGLNNVKKRLNLLYPGQHAIDIQESENEFRVLVKLKMMR